MFSQYPALGHSTPRCDTFNPSPPAEFASGLRPAGSPRVPVPALRGPVPGPLDADGVRGVGFAAPDFGGVFVRVLFDEDDGRLLVEGVVAGRGVVAGGVAGRLGGVRGGAGGAGAGFGGVGAGFGGDGAGFGGAGSGSGAGGGAAGGAGAG